MDSHFLLHLLLFMRFISEKEKKNNEKYVVFVVNREKRLEEGGGRLEGRKDRFIRCTVKEIFNVFGKVL